MKPRRRASEGAKYGQPGFVGGQPRVSELVPRRIATLALWLFAGLSVIAGLEAAYFYMPRFAAGTSDGTIAAFDLDGEGCLAVWFSSLLLGLASLVCLLIFSIRRHKADDYHGRYRVWLWAAGVWLVMSIDEAGSLHEGFKELMSRTSGTRILGDGSLWWVLGYGLALLAVGTRLSFQLAASRAAACLFVLAALCLGGAAGTQLGWILPESGTRGIMLEEGLEMAGDLMLLLAMVAFARYVVLEAQGEVAPRQSQRRRPRNLSASGARDDLSSPPAQPASKPDLASGRPQHLGSSTASPGVDKGHGFRIDAAHVTTHRRLSKAERRALRRSQQAERDYG